MGGCVQDARQGPCWKEVLNDGYHESRSWKLMTIEPPMNSSYLIQEPASFCLYWDGFIYASFYTSSPSHNHKPEPRIYSYDTKAGKWMDSGESLQTLAYDSMAAIVPVF